MRQEKCTQFQYTEYVKLYHYTHLNKWQSIKTGSYVSNHVPGLGNSLRVGTTHPEAVNTAAVFSLLEPTPQSWVNNSLFPDTWDRLQAYIGSLLLEVEVDPEEEGIYVLDRGHMEGYIYKDEPNYKKRQPKFLRSLRRAFAKDTSKFLYDHKTEEAAEGAYIASKVPLNEYLKDPEKYHFSLPEVIITKNVTLDRIAVSVEQPKLDAELKSESVLYKVEILEQIRKVPELQSWLHDYETREVPRDGGKYGNETGNR